MKFGMVQHRPTTAVHSVMQILRFHSDRSGWVQEPSLQHGAKYIRSTMLEFVIKDYTVHERL